MEPENPPQIPKYQKNTAFTRTFSKSSRELSLLSCDMSQEPKGICSEKLVQMNFFNLGGFLSGGLPLVIFGASFGGLHIAPSVLALASEKSA